MCVAHVVVALACKVKLTVHAQHAYKDFFSIPERLFVSSTVEAICCLISPLDVTM